MFKNLKQKTLNSSYDSSLISSRSVSNSSLADENNSTAEPNVSVISNRHQSLESLSSINEDQPPTPRAVFGNLEDIIDDLKNQIGKKDNENKKLQKFIKELEKRINELGDSCKKEEEGRLALERAYEKLEDTNEVNIRQLQDKFDSEKAAACNQLQNQVEKLKKDNEKLSKKNNSADSVAWQNKAESLEKAYQELVEIQEHSEIQVQKMKDLIKMKDEELQALQSRFDETEERCRQIQLQASSKSQLTSDKDSEKSSDETETVAKEDLDALNWQVASYQQEIEALEKHVVKLELELEESQQKSSDKDFRINRLREDIKNKDLVIETQKCDSLELANAVDRTQNLLSDARTELEVTRSSYTKSLSDLQEEIDSITIQYKDCKQECRKQTELVEQLQIAASATKTLKTNLQDDLDSWKSRYEESEAILANHVAAAEKQQQLIESLELQLEKQGTLNATILALREELAASQQNEEELKQENEYLTVARESWLEERNELEADFKRQMDNQMEKNKALKEEVELFRRSSQATIFPVSSSLQAKFVKGVTEVDIATRKDIEEELADLREKCRGLETELASKTKQLKQNQQHLTDMKRTLQDELRGGSNVSPSTSRASPPVSSKKYDITAAGALTDNSHKNSNDYTLMEPINIAYLKHCVIKFMCSLDNETAYLLRVISVLLKFTEEEHAIVLDALRCRSSWFSKAPPKSLRKLKSTKDSK